MNFEKLTEEVKDYSKKVDTKQLVVGTAVVLFLVVVAFGLLGEEERWDVEQTEDGFTGEWYVDDIDELRVEVQTPDDVPEKVVTDDGFPVTYIQPGEIEPINIPAGSLVTFEYYYDEWDDYTPLGSTYSVDDNYQSATVTGTVVDERGDPIPSNSITVQDTDLDNFEHGELLLDGHEIEAGSDGEFEFEGSVGRSYIITVESTTVRADVEEDAEKGFEDYSVEVTGTVDDVDFDAGEIVLEWDE